MIQRYRFGAPFCTDAVVQPLAQQNGPVPYLTGDAACWQYTMAEEDIVYGLGESIRGINKRGWHYTSWCSDDPTHTEEKVSLYGAHNFLLVSGRETFGLFIDFGGKIDYDIGYTRRDILTITPAEPNYDLYLITGESPAAICKQLRQLTGRSYIPPKWAFGLSQSRWGYVTEEDVRAVAEGYRANDLPLDSICMDIDYMQDYRDFTVNPQRFPDLPGLAAAFKADGLHLVPIIDAGVKQLAEDATCAEGLAGDYFCKDAAGKPFVGAVWPGHAYFPDFLRPEVRRWFGDKYAVLLNMGIEGFWNDMNEPAIFYSEKRLTEALDEISAMKGQNVDINGFFHLKDLVLGLANSKEDYSAIYHTVDGQPVQHSRVHNLYGTNMTRAAGEAFARLRPEARTLMYSRASSIGAHRYGGIWLGDNCAWWAHLLQNVRQLPNVNMCGFLYSGADLCGFGCDTTPDLALRWLEFGLFTPLMRNHSALGTRVQEYYRFAEELPAMRNMLRLRYALIPYLYSEFMKAALNDEMLFRPLAFDYPEDHCAKTVEDQLLLGNELMLAPVYTQNATGRTVYLPEPMKLLRLRAVDDFDAQLLPAGHHYVDCALDEVLVFVRPGKAVPVARPANRVADLDEEHFTFWSNLAEGEAAAYLLYHDDGTTTRFDAPDHYTTLTVKAE